MLDINSISKTYRGPDGKLTALHEVSLHTEAGAFVAVQGKSGCGKSTLLLAAGGLLAPDQGEVVIDGQDLYALSPNARAAFRARTLGFVFQQFHLIPYLSVLDNILAAALSSKTAGAEEHARQLVERFGLTDRLHHVPAELSTGERQRTAMARALLNHPQLILADEPTGNLDRENAANVLEHLGQFSKAGGTVLLVTHDPLAASHANKTITMEQGKLVSP